MTSHVQSVLFDTSMWTVEAAARWLLEHRYKLKKIHVTDRYLRFRQRRPDYKKYHYRVHRLGSGITLELGFPEASK